jgi:hypothetical protein
MKRFILGLALLALTLTTPGFAQEADPVATANRSRFLNFLGTTGQLYTPSAYPLGNGEWSAHLHGNSDLFGGGVATGLGSRLELSANLFDLDDERDSRFDNDGTRFLANAKYMLLTETNNRPAFSVGVVDAFDQLDVDPSWYLVASKYFTRGQTEQDFSLVGHLGFGGGIYDENLFAGAELLFNRNISATAELMDGRFNLGARYRTGGFSAQVGLFDFDEFGAGVTYTTRFR